MNEDIKKNMGIILIILEMILAGCLVLLSFIYGFWVDSSQIIQGDKVNWWLIGIERQLVIFIAALFAAWLIHTLNTFWIARTGMGSRRSSFIFSTGVFVLIFLGGLAGVILFIIQLPFQ